jgi:cation transport ATPase
MFLSVLLEIEPIHWAYCVQFVRTVTEMRIPRSALLRDVRSTISVLIVAGACGNAAGTPFAILAGIGRSAQLGSIIEGGLYLESLATVIRSFSIRWAL